MTIHAKPPRWFFFTSVEGKRHDGKNTTERTGHDRNNGGRYATTEALNAALRAQQNGGTANDAFKSVYNDGFQEYDIDYVRGSGTECNARYSVSADKLLYHPTTDKGAGEDFNFIGGFDSEATANATNDASRGVIIITDEKNGDVTDLKSILDEHYKVPAENIHIVRPNSKEYEQAVADLNGKIGANGKVIVHTSARMVNGTGDLYARKGDCTRETTLPKADFSKGITTLSSGDREVVVIGGGCHSSDLK